HAGLQRRAERDRGDLEQPAAHRRQQRLVGVVQGRDRRRARLQPRAHRRPGQVRLDDARRLPGAGADPDADADADADPHAGAPPPARPALRSRPPARAARPGAFPAGADLQSPRQSVVHTAKNEPLIRYGRRYAGGAMVSEGWGGGAPMVLAMASYAGNTSA